VPSSRRRPGPAATSFAPPELPAAAVRRVERQRESGTWSSDLTVCELAAIRSAGFSPAGQVIGSSVHHVAWRSTGVSLHGPTPVVELPDHSRALYSARRMALGRMREEARRLGADGVVAVRLVLRRFEQAPDALEITALGTAIRRWARPLASPFLSTVDGQGFAKLLRAGLVPRAVVLGLSTVHVHTDEPTELLMRGSSVEIPLFGAAVERARSLAMARLARDAENAHADGCVGSDVALDVWRTPCGLDRERDHLLQFTAVATAVARFAPPSRDVPDAVVILR